MSNQFERFNPCCTYEPPTKYHDGYTGFELLNDLINKYNEVIDYINTLQSQLDSKEDSVNITNNRKLSETGDFTGTWFKETKTSVDSRINNVESTYNTIVDLLNSLTNLNIEIIDGQFFTSTDPITEIDAGLFTAPPTEEIDAGLFIYPCICEV